MCSGGCGVWREDVECGGRMWSVEGGCGVWRKDVEGGCGGRMWGVEE